MRVSVTHAARLIPLLICLPLLQGCDEKSKQPQTQALAPPIIDTPPPEPKKVSPADLPPPVMGSPQAKPSPASSTENASEEAPKKPVHHPKKPQAGTQLAGSGTAQSVSAIGELSSGASGNLRSQAEDAINFTEKGLNGISRPMTDGELKTAAQIRGFLKQAREALTTGDVDGAMTLTKKAKVLLAELNP